MKSLHVGFAAHLQQLCDHLSISTTVYTSVDLATIEQLTDRLKQDKQTLAPLLLLDYEYYDTSTIVVGSNSSSDSLDTYPQQLKQVQTESATAILSNSPKIATSIDRPADNLGVYKVDKG